MIPRIGFLDLDKLLIGLLLEPIRLQAAPAKHAKIPGSLKQKENEY